MLNSTLHKNLNFLRLVVQINAYLSTMVLFIACILLFSYADTYFDLNVQLYGAMANNFRIMALNLMIMEIAVWSLCFLRNNYYSIALLGLFHLILIGSLEVYNELNQLDIKTGLTPILIYAGVSQISFGIMYHKIKTDLQP